MLLIRHKNNIINALRNGCVATIGAFDGLHLGHRTILDRVLAEAHARQLPALVMSFEPTPKEFFSRAAPPARLMRFREKYAAFAEVGMDVFFCPRFDAGMAAMSPDEFMDQLLLGVANVRHLVVGDDFRFAHKRAGSIVELEAKGLTAGFTVERLSSVVTATERVSSSVVRAALQAGELAQAARLLGRPYRMSGQVVPGQKLGRELGMPTANVRLKRSRSPLAGVFAVRVGGLGDGVWHDAVASIGTRPTVAGVEPLLEVHLFDFDRDIYGAHIQVEFVAKLREEVHFPDLESLQAQMFRDADEARARLGERAQVS
jgi:riboflavin kinase/FMN adenylyltransferase